MTLRNLKLALVLAPAALFACRHVDPHQELEVAKVETYWVVDSSVGNKQYLAPAVRFEVRNRSQEPRHSIEVQAVFRRQGETEQWGSDWRKVTAPGKALEPGQSSLSVLRSDGRYFSTGTPESMLTHPQFRDARVQVFVRVGSSAWTKFVDTAVERRIGSRAAQTGEP